MNCTPPKSVLALGAILVLASVAQGAEKPKRLVEPLAPTTLQRGNHSLTFAAPTTRGKWFLSVSATGRRARVRIKLNGTAVVPDQPCAGLPPALLVPISVQGTNTLQIRVSGRPPAQVTLSVQGIVPEQQLPPNTGVRVAKTRLLSKTLRISSGWRGYGWGYKVWQVQSPTTEGLFVLEGSNGPGNHRPLSFALARWNGSLALGLRARRETRRTRLDVTQTTNLLSVFGKGRVGSRARFKVVGYLIDETAPTIAFSSPPAGGVVQAATPVEIAFSDDQALDPNSLQILLNGQDVTASFSVSATGAVTTLGALPQNLLVSGANQLEARISDRACNEATATVDFQLGGGSPPQFVPPPADLVSEQAGPTGTLVTFPLPTVIDDDDPNPTVVCSPASGSLFPAGVSTVICTATDASGNASTATFTVTVQDTIPPSLSALPDLTVEQSSAAGATLTYTAPAATDAGTPNPAVVCSPPSGSLFPAGTTTVTCTATDAAGNVGTRTFQVTVQDTTAPSFALAPDLVLEQSGPAGTVVSYVAPVATDAVTAAPSVVCTPPAGTLFPAGATQVTCTATDAAGNQASTTFLVTVRDTTAPSFASAPDLVFEQDSPAGTVVSYVAPVATDAVTAAPSVVCTPAAGTLFPAGVTQVTCTATDGAGNQATTSFQVTVQDSIPPTIATNPDLSFEQATPAGTLVSYLAPVASDAASAPTVACAPPSGSVFPAGTTVVTCTATDASGNQTSSSFQVTVQDTIAPTLPTIANFNLEQTSPAGALLSYVAPVTSDVADPNPTLTCVPAVGTLIPPGVTTVTCTATDTAGNSSSTSFEVTVQDTTAPAIAAQPDLLFEQSGPAGSVVIYPLPAVSDAADPAPLVVCAPASGATFPAGQTQVTCTATDASGNSSDSTFLITVQDTTAPAIGPTPNLTVPATSATGAVVTYAPPSATDAVDPAPSVVCVPSSGTLFPVGTTSVTCLATDAAGNVAASNFTVTVDPFVTTAVTLSVELVPSAASVTAGTTRDLRIRALDALGQVTPGFTGTVLLSTSDGLAPLDGTLVSFGASDQGVRLLPGLAFLRTAGTFVIDAETLAAPILQGSLSVEVLPAAPSLLTALSGAGDRILITGETPPAIVARVEDAFGNPNPGVSVRLVIGSDETQDAATDASGQATFTPSVISTPGVRACVLSTPNLSLAPTTFVWTVNAGVPPPGPSVLTLISGGSDATIDEGERAPTLALRVNSGSAAGAPKSGQVVTWTIRDDQGALLAVRRGISAADGSVSIPGPRLIALGVQGATVTVSNPQGAPLTFQVTVLAKQHVSGFVLDASRDPGPALEGVTVRVRGAGLTTTTERDGSFRFESVPAGHQVLEFDGRALGTFAQVSQALVVSGTTALARPLFLPRFEDPGVAVPLNGQGETTQAIAVPLVSQPLARLTIAAGARVAFPSGAAAEIAAAAVELDEMIWPLPDRPTPATAVLFGPAETQFPDGATLELPNDLGLPAGTPMEVYSADLATGAFTLLGAATVSPDATRVVTTGPLVTHFSCFIAVPAASSTPDTVLTGRVLDEDDSPLVGATVSYLGASVTTLADDPLTTGVDEAGTFAIAGVSGEGPPATASATRINQNGYPESARSLPAARVPGGQTDLGTLKISAKTAISGRLVFDNGSGVVPTGGGRASVLARVTPTAGDGTFVVPDVPSQAGPVKVFGYELTQPSLIKGFVVASGLIPHGSVEVGDVLLEPQPSSFATLQEPALALGTTSTPTPPLGRPEGSAADLQATHTCADCGRVFVAMGQEILIWHTAPTTTNQQPDVVLGAPGPVGPGVPSGPTAVYSDHDRLYVGDLGRVLVFEDPASLETGDVADFALGQADLTGTLANRGTGQAAADTISLVGGIYSNGELLYVLDRSNNRLLGWRTPPQSMGQAADFVIGQPSFTSTTSDFEGVTARTLCATPRGLSGDSNRLYVADTSNHRVLVFSPLPDQTLASASLVLGQTTFSGDVPGQLNMPTSIASDGQELVVSASNGVFAWSQPPTQSGQAPQQLGTTAGQVTAVALSAGKLYAAKTLRGVEIFSDSAAFAAGEAPEVALLSAGPGVTGLDAGRSFVGSGHTAPLPGGGLIHQNLGALGASRWDTVLHNNQPADSISGTRGIRIAFAAAGGRLYSVDVLDPGIEARAIGGLDLDSPPQFVLPAPSTSTLAANGDSLFLGERFSPFVRLFSPLPSGPVAPTTLNLDLGGASPVSVRGLAAGTEFLAVQGQGRILLFPTGGLDSSPAGTTPSLVLGQGSISENVLYPTDPQDLVHIGLGFNQEVATDGTRVYARGANQQILVWETLPTTPGEPADAILAGRVVRVSADGESVFASLATGGIGKWTPGVQAATPRVSSLETPVAPQTTGVIPISFTLKDLQSDATDVSLAYSIDDGQTFSPLTLAGGATTGLATSPAGVVHSALWDSRADIPQRAGLVRVRVLPQDASGAGIGNHTYRFGVDNASLSVAEVITEVRELARGVRRVEVSVDVTNRGVGPSVLNPALLTFSDAQGADLSGFFTVQAEGQAPALIQPGGIARFRFRVDVSATAPLGSVVIGATVTGSALSTGTPLGPESARVPALWELVEGTTTATFLEGPALEAFVGQDGPRTYTLQLTPTTDLVNLRIVSGAAFSPGSPFLNVPHGSALQLRGVVAGGTTLYVNRGTTTVAAFPLEVRAPANYLVSPAAVDFGTVAIGSPLTRTITVESLSGTLNVDQIELQPAGAFSLIGVPSLPAAVASGSSTSFTLRYDPQVGASTADLVITTQDALNPLTRVRLEGVGTGDAPALLFAQPSEGACSDGTGQLTLTYADPDGVVTGTLLVTLNGVDVTSNFTAGAGQAAASLAALSPPEGPNSLVASIEDTLGNQGTTTRTFVVDQTAPLLTLVPGEGATVSTTQVPITLTWSDAGCGVNPASLSVLVDGLDRTGAFTTTATGAQATLSLAEGAHTLAVSVADSIGLSASESSNFTVALSASTLTLRLIGADPAATPALTAYDLRVEALTSAGNVDPSFSGEVQISTTPPVAGLDGLRGTLSGGVLTLSGAARFTDLGGVSLTVATTSAPSLQGALGVNVVVDRPGFVTLTRVMDGFGNVSLTGVSFPGLPVGIYVDDVLAQTETTDGTTGAFSANLMLGPTVAHDLQLRAIEPGSQTERQSDVETVVPAPASLSLTLSPEAQDLGLGELSQLQLTQILSNGTSQDVTSQAAYSVVPSGVVDVTAGLLTAVGAGSATITANLNGELATATVNVGPPIMTSTSPAVGEAQVAVTRETIVRFSVPVSTASVASGVIVATFGGEEIPGRLHLSADQRSLTLFYSRPLPPSSRIRVTVNGDLIETPGGTKLDVDRDGVAGGQAEIDFETLTLTASAGTAVCGRVFASELNGQLNVPLQGVHISVDGVADVLSATTDANGDFRIDPAPDGAFFVHIDGSTATNAGIPAGNYYPTVGKVFTTEAGLESKIGNVFLPLIVDGTLTALNATGDTMITLPPSIEAANPDLAGTQLIVPEGALFNDDGSSGGSVGIAPVPPDRLPGPLPPGMEPAFVITVQTDGATNFDQPVGVRFPNTDNLPPGTELGLWSFNHDTGQWETTGTMRVTPDGQWIQSDPGVGIRAPGWHAALALAQLLESVIKKYLEDFPIRPDCQGQPVLAGKIGDTQTMCSGSESRNGECDSCSICKTDKEVILSTGEERFSRTDLVIPGRGQMHFALQRTYRSRMNYDGPLGHGWTFNYNEGLFLEENGDVLSSNTRMNLKTWTRLPDGSYKAPQGIWRSLVRKPDGSFVSLEPDGFKRFYRSDGRLSCHEDRFGNRMLFDYDGSGNLTTVIDVYGREIEFVYEKVAGRDRLVIVRDFIGREVRYSYDARGDLVEARSPAVTGTSTGNDFPDGRGERYEYEADRTGNLVDLNHNLVAVIAPQEVAEGRTEAVQRFEYETDPNSPFFDYCTAEVIGGVRDIDGVPVTAGGRREIAYEMLTQQDLTDQGIAFDPLDPLTIPVGRATITEPNGLVRQYHVNFQQDHILTRVLTNSGKGLPPLRPGEPLFYETRSFYDSDHLPIKKIMPEGNEVHYVYNRSGPRRSQGNLLELRMKAGPRGAAHPGAEDVVVTYTYEPLFNQVRTVTDPRGNATLFTPPLGVASAERYTSRTFFDYQEHTDPIPLAVEFGIDLSSVPRGLGDLNGDGRLDQSFANVVRVQAPNVTLRADSLLAQAQAGSTVQEIFSEIQWNDRGQVIRTIDPEGNVSVTDYYPENDPDGDGTLTWAPYAVLGTDPTGYVRSVTADADVSPRRSTTVPPAALTATLRYDRVGNVISATNPRGITTEIEVNQLNEPVVVTRGADVSGAVFSGQLLQNEAPFRYRSRITRDHNGRAIKTEVENRDGNTQGVGAFVEAVMEYDILNDLRRVAVEVDATTTLVSRFEYDASQLRTRVIKPEGNSSLVVYDERNLPYRVTAGDNDPLVAATVEFDYDRNGNRVRSVDAFDSDGDGNREVSRVVYDGFDRPIRAIDPLGNSSECEYDVASNVVRCRAFGHTPGHAPSPASLDPDGRNSQAVLLSEQLSHHDELSRVYRADQRLLDVASTGFTPQRTPDLRDGNSDTLVTGLVDFDRLSRPVFMTEDDGETTATSYDGVSRVVEAIDALGNRLQRVYDRNSNVVETRSIEVVAGSLAGVIPSETFVTRLVYDQLDRLVRATDNAGQTAYFSYDSRDNLVSRRDPEGPQIPDPLNLFPGQINSGGNSKSYVYDGLNRLLRQVCDLRVGGTGSGALDTSNGFNADGQVTVSMTYDGNSRVQTRTDDNGNATTYLYDALDRQTQATLADGKFHSYVYDRDSALRTHTDPNGTTTTNTYDALNRTVRNVVSTLGAGGIHGPSQRDYAYDGLSRLTAALDDNRTGSGALHSIERTYDSLSRLLEEKQDGRAISNVFTGDGKRVTCTYPGGRVLESTFDGIDRVKTIQDEGDSGPAIAMFDYIGPGGRELRRVLKNGTQNTYLNAAGNQAVGYDAVQRVTRMRSITSGGGTITDFEYGYSRASQRTFERRNHEGGFTDRYTYDSIYRLVQVDYDQDTLVGTPRDLTRSTYQFDGAGNRRSVQDTRTSQGGSAIATSYTPDVTNEYTSIAVGSNPAVSISNSDNGNVRADRNNVYVFDDRNRLVEVADRANGNLVARYQYDALDRRVLKEVFDRGQALAVPLERIGYFYDGWQCVEETSTAGAVVKTYVYGTWIDDVIEAELPDVGDLDGDGNTAELTRLYYHRNSIGSVAAVTGVGGAVVERYRYSDYGVTEVLAGDFSAVAGNVTQVGQAFGFTGRRVDFEEGSGLYYYRLRYYDPEAGRFVSRDPLGIWGDAGNRGNAQNYCGNNPVNRLDPLGLEGASSTPSWAAQAHERAIQENQRALNLGLDSLNKLDELGNAPKVSQELQELMDARLLGSAAEPFQHKSGSRTVIIQLPSETRDSELKVDTSGYGGTWYAIIGMDFPITSRAHVVVRILERHARRYGSIRSLSLTSHGGDGAACSWSGMGPLEPRGFTTRLAKRFRQAFSKHGPKSIWLVACSTASPPTLTTIKQRSLSDWEDMSGIRTWGAPNTTYNRGSSLFSDGPYYLDKGDKWLSSDGLQAPRWNFHDTPCIPNPMAICPGPFTGGGCLAEHLFPENQH